MRKQQLYSLRRPSSCERGALELEAEVAIGSFVQRFGQVGIVGDPVWNGRINLRGLESLIVDLT